MLSKSPAQASLGKTLRVLARRGKANRSLAKLATFLDANPGIDLSCINLFDDAVVSSLNWKGIKKRRNEVLSQLQTYQRVMRLVEGADRTVVLGLMGRGIGSARHVTAIPRPRFLEAFADLFDGDRKAVDRVYQCALVTRSALLLRYLRFRQSHEPHARQINRLTRG